MPSSASSKPGGASRGSSWSATLNLEEGSSAAEAIMEDLAHHIARWELDPGQQLSERALSEWYGVSRTPVREALRRLEQAQLIARTSNAGYVVKTSDLVQIEQSYVVRIALEEVSVRLAAARMSDPRFEELRTLTKESAALSPSDPEVLRETFHERLAQLSGNGVLARMLHELGLSIQGYRRLDAASAGDAQHAQEEHLEILELLAAGEVHGAVALMRSHIERSQRVVKTLIEAGATRLMFSSSGDGPAQAGTLAYFLRNQTNRKKGRTSHA